MIVYDLSCPQGHSFEGWFASSADFNAQAESGIVSCPYCGSAEIAKAPMTPAVGRKSNQIAGRQTPPASQPLANAPMPAEVVQALEKLAEAQAQALKNSNWVGTEFAEQSRAMHYGDREQRMIHGEATAEVARGLLEEGIAVAPLPFPIIPLKDMN
jgi:hypothetical protein